MFVVGSVKGAPGASTLASALAMTMAHPDRLVLVVEADPQGGSLVPRLGLSYEPGLTSLAAVRGAALSPELIWDHAQPVASGLRVLGGPPGPEQANAALRTLGERFATVLSTMPPNVHVLVDVGRLSRQSAALPLVLSATAAILVTRLTLDAVHHLPAVVPALLEAGAVIELASVGDKPFAPTEVADHLGVGLLAVLPDDSRHAAAVADGSLTNRGMRRSLYARVVAELGAQLVERRPPAAGSLIALADSSVPGTEVEPDPDRVPPADAPVVAAAAEDGGDG